MKPLRRALFLLLVVALVLPVMALASPIPPHIVTPEQEQAQQRHYEIWRQNQDRPLRVVRIARLFVVQPDFDDFDRLESYFERYVFATEILGARVEVVNTVIACNAVIRNDSSLLFTTQVAAANELARLLRNVDRDGNPYNLIADRNAGRIDGVALFSDAYHTAAAGFLSGIHGAEFLRMGQWYQYYQGTGIRGITGDPPYEGLSTLLPITILYDNLLHGPTHHLESWAHLYGRSWLDMFESLDMTHFGSAEHVLLGWETTNFTDNCADRLRSRLGSGSVQRNYTNPENSEFWLNPDHPVFSVGHIGSNQIRREVALRNMMRAFGEPGFNVDGFPTDPVVWLYGVVPFESYFTGAIEVNGLFYHPDEHDYKYRWLPAIQRGEQNVQPYFGDRATATPTPTPSPRPTTNQLTLELDGVDITPTDAPPFINSDSRTMVPLRVIGENMDAGVDWNRTDRIATITRPDLTITITIGDYVMMVNGSPVQMDTVAVLIDGRTFVPLRFIAEALGLTPDFDRNTRVVSLTS